MENGETGAPCSAFHSKRRAFQKKDDSSSSCSNSSGSGSSSSGSSSSGSSSSSSTSGDDSSVEILGVQQAPSTKSVPLHPSDNINHSTSPFFGGGNALKHKDCDKSICSTKDTTTPPRNDITKAKIDTTSRSDEDENYQYHSPNQQQQQDVDEFAHLDDDDLAWLDQDMLDSPESHSSCNKNPIPQEVMLVDTSPKPLSQVELLEDSFDLSQTNSRSTSEGKQHTYDNEDNVNTIAIVVDEHKVISDVDHATTTSEKAEIEPKYYAPPSPCPRPDPIVHHLSLRDPQYIPVNQLFRRPVSLLWQNKFDKFNPMQSRVSRHLVHSNDSLVVSSPTGAGKTAVFEMAIARHINDELETLKVTNPHDWHQRQAPAARKIVYIAPCKALCEERYDDWSRRLSNLKLGMRVAMITGDVDTGDSVFSDIAKSHLIVTTPEKWDSLTRRWTERYVLLASVKLLLIDEVHLLGDPSRGSCLESVVCRMKTMHRATQSYAMTQEQILGSSFVHATPKSLASHLRIVAVSATLPNIGDIAAFLEANEAFVFDNSYRPVPLETHVVACGEVREGKEFMFNKAINRYLPGVLQQFGKGKSTLVFCHTKKETEQLALELARMNGIGSAYDNPDLAGQTSVSNLQRCLLRSVAYHNAGLDSCDRKLVEQAFLKGKIKCLCCTSTLAVGVNLPASLVVIKGTNAWRGSGQGYQEIDKGTLLQMIGRAGRQGFDTTGTAVIMTDSRSEQKYKKLASNSNDSLSVVESQLMPSLIKSLNSEISQRVITNFETAKNWMATTFFFVCAQKSDSIDTDDHLQWLIPIVGKALRSLDKSGIVKVGEDNGDIVPMVASHIMCSNLVDFQAMSLLLALPFDSGIEQILKALSEIEALHRPVRRHEKKVLNEVAKLVKYKLPGPPSKVRVQQPQQKSFLLLQAAIGQIPLDDFTLRQETGTTIDYATRMLMALEEHSHSGSKQGYVALQSLLLRRSCSVGMWGADYGVLNQLPGVGTESTGKLRFNGITSFDHVFKASEEKLEAAASRCPPFGKEMHKAVRSILRNKLTIFATVEGNELVCTLQRNDSIPNGLMSEDNANSSVAVKYSLLGYTDRQNSCIFFMQDIDVDSPSEYRFPRPKQYGKIWVHAIGSLMGLDQCCTIEGEQEVVKSDFATIPTKNSSKLDAKPGKSKAKRSADKRIREPKSKSRNTLQDGFKKQQKRFKPSPPAVTPVSQTVASHAETQQEMTGRTDDTIILTESVDPGSIATTRRSVDAQRHAVPPARRSYEQSPQRSAGMSQHSAGTHSCSIPTSQTTTQMPPQRARISPHPPPNSLWNRQKREQRTLQKTAFRSKSENPFARFKHDPNNVEASIDALVAASKETSDSGVLPADAFGRNERRQFDSNTFRRGPTNLSGGRGGRGRGRTRAPRSNQQRIPMQDLLRMKGDEQNCYFNSRGHEGADYHMAPHSNRSPYPPNAQHQLMTQAMAQPMTQRLSPMYNSQQMIQGPAYHAPSQMHPSPHMYHTISRPSTQSTRHVCHQPMVAQQENWMQPQQASLGIPYQQDPMEYVGGHNEGTDSWAQHYTEVAYGATQPYTDEMQRYPQQEEYPSQDYMGGEQFPENAFF